MGGIISISGPRWTTKEFYEDGSNYKGSIATFGSCFYCEVCTKLEIRNANFDTFVASTGGAIMMIYNEMLSNALTTSVLIEDTTFTNGEAIASGGAIAISEFHPFSEYRSNY